MSKQDEQIVLYFKNLVSEGVASKDAACKTIEAFERGDSNAWKKIINVILKAAKQ